MTDTATAHATDQTTGRRADVVVAGIDGSPSSRAALAWAADEAERRGWRLYVLTAWQSPNPSTSGRGAPPSTLSEPDSYARQAEALVGREVQAVLGGETSATRRAVRGRPVDVLLEAADHAGVLVVGAPGPGVRSRWHGVVGEYLVRHAACPVVVVPDPSATDRGPVRPRGQHRRAD
jgi:nucleotide-binding universal stress UspA family protein